MASVKNCQLVESSAVNPNPANGAPKADQDKEFKLQLGKVLSPVLASSSFRTLFVLDDRGLF